jgi:toxin ParE1/3/4
MSAHRPIVGLTREAEDDYETILIYTEQTWGQEQRASYWARIRQTLESLRDHPKRGHPRDDLFSGCRSVRVERHIIYYHQPQPHHIEVVRILHSRQDPAGNVEAPTS